jgi:hydroxymethylglutaryl-CoA reductase (NADPH)
MFPAFLLNKVYVSKSLKNTPDGFEFTLKNVVDSGTLGGVKSLTVDGAEIPLAAIVVKTALGEKRAEEISPRNYISMRYNAEAAITVAGEPLAGGKHEIKLVVSILEAGQVELKFEDEI